MAEITKELQIQLGNQLEKLRIDQGISLNDTDALSGLRSQVEVPEGFNISSLNDFFRRKQKNPKAVVSLTPSKAGAGEDVRTVRSEFPGQKSIKTTNPLTAARRNKQTNQFIDLLTGDPSVGGLAYDPAVVEKYLFETDNQLRALINAVKRQNQKLPKGKKISFGHLNRLSHSINSPRNVFLELLTDNIDKGDRYKENQAAMMAMGNPTKEGLSWMDNWKRDFLIWADQTENGGSGVLPQRGQFGALIERQIHQLTGNQFDKLDDAGKLDAVNQVNDLLTDLESRNQWLPSEGKQLKKWGILSELQKEQALAFVNDNEARKFLPEQEVAELGRRLGGIGDTIKVSKGAAQGSRVLKKLTKFAPIPVASTLLGIGSHAVAKEEYEQNPNALNWTQLQGERIALGGSALSTAGVPLLTNPVTAVPGAAMIAAGETVDAVGTGISLGTDVVKGAMNPAKISTKNRKLFRHGGNKKEKAHVIKQRQLMLEMLAQERKNKEFETGGR